MTKAAIATGEHTARPPRGITGARPAARAAYTAIPRDRAGRAVTIAGADIPMPGAGARKLEGDELAAWLAQHPGVAGDRYDVYAAAVPAAATED